MRELTTAEMSLVAGGNGYMTVWEQIDAALDWGEIAAGIYNAAGRCLLRDIRLSLDSDGQVRSDCGQVGIEFYYEIDWSDYYEEGDSDQDVLNNYYSEHHGNGGG